MAMPGISFIIVFVRLRHWRLF